MKPSGVVRRVVPVDVSDAGSFADFYAATRLRLLRVLIVTAVSLGDAEDALQEAYIRTARRWTRVSRYDNPEAFIRRVAAIRPSMPASADGGVTLPTAGTAPLNRSRRWTAHRWQ